MGKIKALALSALSLLLAVTLSACELPMMGFDDYDVSGYIQAFLDSSYHNSHQSFMNVTQSTQEAAQENNTVTIANAAINFCNRYSLSPSEEQIERLRQMMGQALLQAKYLVKEEKKVDGGYYIEVEVTPITSFADLEGIFDTLRTQAQEEASRSSRQQVQPSPTPTPEPESEEGGEDEGWEEEPTPSPSPTPVPTPEPTLEPPADPNEIYVEKVLTHCEGLLGALAFDATPITIALEIRQTNEGELQLDLNQLDTIDQTVLRF